MMWLLCLLMLGTLPGLVAGQENGSVVGPPIYSNDDASIFFLVFLDKECWHDARGYGLYLKNWMWFMPVTAVFLWFLFFRARQG